MTVASPDCNGLPILVEYPLEQLLLPFGLVHLDAILAALEERGLKKDSATTDQELPAQFRCDKNKKPKTGPFGILYPDGHLIYFQLKMAGEEDKVELAEINIPTEPGFWRTDRVDSNGDGPPQHVLRHMGKYECSKKGEDAESEPKRRRIS